MLAKLFNNISIQSLIRALLFSVLVLVAAWSMADPGQASLQILAWEWPVSEVLYKLILSLLLVGISWRLNSRINDIGFLKNDYQLMPVLMLLFTPILFENGSMELILVLPLGIFLATRLYQLVQTVDPSFILFDSGVLLALMTLLVPESIFFLLIIWIATLNFGHLSVRTFLMPHIGMAGVYFMLFTLLYWIFDINVLPIFWEGFMSLRPAFELNDFTGFWVYLPLLLVALPSFLETSQVYGKASVKKRQIFTFLTLYFLVALLAGLLIQSKADAWIWLLLPLAIFVVNLLHYLRKNWYKNIVYLLLILFLFFSLLF